MARGSARATAHHDGQIDDVSRAAMYSGSTGVNRSPMSEAVVEHIRTLIFEGELRPGDRVSRDEIAETLGTSVSPVREAMLILARDGLLVIEPHRGAFVSELDEAFVIDHYEIVGLLLGLACERVARATVDRGAVLGSLERIRDEIASSQDPMFIYDKAFAFHRVLNTAGGTRKLRAVERSLAPLVPRNLLAVVPETMDLVRTSTASIAEAIAAGDADRAFRIAREYMARHGALVVQSLWQRSRLLSRADPDVHDGETKGSTIDDV